MIPLPPKKLAPIGEASIVSVTELRLRWWRDVPRLVALALKLRRSFRSADGAIELTLVAALHRRTFWTVSLWRDDEALRAYSVSHEHATVMRRFRGALERSRSTRLLLGSDGPVHWRDAVKALDGGDPYQARTDRDIPIVNRERETAV